MRVIEAFKWTPNGYLRDISTLFPHVMGVTSSTFHGMTDFLIMGSNPISVVCLAQSILRSIKVGDAGKYKTCEITIATAMKRWPEKVGELMASMYLFGTPKYLNQLTGTPQMLKFKTYGVLYSNTWSWVSATQDDIG